MKVRSGISLSVINTKCSTQGRHQSYFWTEQLDRHKRSSLVGGAEKKFYKIDNLTFFLYTMEGKEEKENLIIDFLILLKKVCKFRRNKRGYVAMEQHVFETAFDYRGRY
jgi:hypothetical protein